MMLTKLSKCVTLNTAPRSALQIEGMHCAFHTRQYPPALQDGVAGYMRHRSAGFARKICNPFYDFGWSPLFWQEAEATAAASATASCSLLYPFKRRHVAPF